jgi:hypothetical protein
MSPHRARRHREGIPMTSEIRKKQWRDYGKKRRQIAEYREAQRARYRAWHRENGSDPELLARKAQQQRGYRNDPALRLRHIARWLVSRAIKSGKLTRLPCEICGNPEVHGHHEDYSKPLDVRWLCPKHHYEHHQAKATA